jgi:hypothetical protein
MPLGELYVCLPPKTAVMLGTEQPAPTHYLKEPGSHQNNNSPLGDISSRIPADVKGLAKGFRRPSSSNPLAVSEIQVRERG